MIKLRTMWDEEPRSDARWIERITAEPNTDMKDPADSRVLGGLRDSATSIPWMKSRKALARDSPGKCRW